jgi:hypothetical protein
MGGVKTPLKNLTDAEIELLDNNLVAVMHKIGIDF